MFFRDTKVVPSTGGWLYGGDFFSGSNSTPLLVLIESLHFQLEQENLVLQGGPLPVISRVITPFTHL